MRDKSIFWWALDPLLLKIAARLEHLRRLRLTADPVARWATVATFNETVRFLDGASLANQGSKCNIKIGDFSHVAGELVVVVPTGRLCVGTHCYVGPGSRIWVQSSVKIGDAVLISHSVDIHDTNAHSSNRALRTRDAVNTFERGMGMDWQNVRSKPIVIEDNVWIGFKSIILRGVTIGRGSIVAAGAVVTKSVPANSLVAGNPARIVRGLERDNE